MITSEQITERMQTAEEEIKRLIAKREEMVSNLRQLDAQINGLNGAMAAYTELMRLTEEYRTELPANDTPRL